MNDIIARLNRPRRGFERSGTVPPSVAQHVASSSYIEGFATGRSLFLKGETIVVEGSRATGVFLQLNGWTAAECASRDGELVLLDFLTCGEFVGVDEEDEVSSYSVTALDDVSMLEFARSDFQALIRENEPIRVAYTASVRAASRRLHRTRMALASRSAAERVCAVLLATGERVVERPSTNGLRRRLPVSQARFAGAVDLTPVAVNRVVQMLRGKDIIDWDQSGVAILDMERLALVRQCAKRQVAP